MDTEFADTATDCSVVAKIALLDAIDTDGDSRPRALVAQSLQPAKKGSALDYLRSEICIRKETAFVKTPA